MEPPKISQIFEKSIAANQDSNAVTKRTKHRLDEYDEADTFEHECPMHKMQKLDESELQETSTQVQDVSDYSHELKEFDFDLESFLREQSIRKTIQAATLAVPAVATSVATLAHVPKPTSFSIIKNDKILAELNYICDEPIKTISAKDDETAKKDIQLIADLLQDTVKPTKFIAPACILDPFEKSEAILTANLKMLFNSLIFKNYDFSKGAFDPDSASILYEQLYKVNVYINKTETREFTIYFGFPFYLSIRINILGKIFIARKNIYKLLEKSEEIEKIHYYSANTGFNILDVITAAKFIGFIITRYFTSGFDLLSKLLHTIEIYKTNSEKLTFNKVTLSFERFVRLYKQVIKNISMVPIRD